MLINVSRLNLTFKNRKITDGERTVKAIESVAGKRLMYKDPIAKK